MNAVLLVHIVAGSIGLLSGYVALFVTKGATLHRRAGTVFVWVMLTMTMTGALISAARGTATAINLPAAFLTAYLVVTGLTTIRPPRWGARGLHVAGMLLAFVLGLASLRFAFEAVANGGTREGMPAFPFFLFGGIGMLAGAQDLRMLRRGAPTGALRLARHLWRMCFALLIAAMSFFLGQADELPKALRIPALLAAPILAVLVTMLYWLWRVRIRRSLRGLVGVGAAEAA
jgi:uncharacterized membrane protein